MGTHVLLVANRHSSNTVPSLPASFHTSGYFDPGASDLRVEDEFPAIATGQREMIRCQPLQKLAGSVIP